jgi:hypothetical protein
MNLTDTSLFIVSQTNSTGLDLVNKEEETQVLFLVLLLFLLFYQHDVILNYPGQELFIFQDSVS